MTRKRAGVYCRISKDRVGAGLGVERQREDCQRFADKHGFDVVELYSDNDVSAYSGKRRPAYEKMLNDIQAGKIDVVITWHADRLHRAPVELERYITVCDPRNVPTHVYQAGELDLSTASGRMTARITGAVARHESEHKSERVKRQKQQAMAKGLWLGGRRPFGFAPDGYTVRPTAEQLEPMYRRAAELHGHNMPSSDELIELARRYTAEADAIVTATARVLAGESMRSISVAWNKAELTTSTGGTWNVSRIRNVLLRPRNAGYTGFVRKHGAKDPNMPQVFGEAKWQALITKDDWEALRAMAADRRYSTLPGNRSRKLVGSFLYLCGECGGRMMSAGTRAADGQGRYTCVEHRHVSRMAGPLDDIVLDLVGEWLRIENATPRVSKPDVAPLHAKIDALRQREREIAALYADPDSGMTTTQFKVSNERIQTQLKELRGKLGAMLADDALAAVLGASDPELTFRAGSIDVQRAIIDTVMTVTINRSPRGRLPGGGYFDPDSIKIEWKVPAAKRVKATRD